MWYERGGDMGARKAWIETIKKAPYSERSFSTCLEYVRRVDIVITLTSARFTWVDDRLEKVFDPHAVQEMRVLQT